MLGQALGPRAFLSRLATGSGSVQVPPGPCQQNLRHPSPPLRSGLFPTRTGTLEGAGDEPSESIGFAEAACAGMISSARFISSFTINYTPRFI